MTPRVEYACLLARAAYEVLAGLKGLDSESS